MEIKSTNEDGIITVLPEGDVDMHSSPLLRAELKKYYNNDTKAILIDLSKVPYMDSSGIASLVECLQWEKANGKKMVLYGINERVLGIFEMAKLHTLFTITDEKTAALQGLKP